MTAILFNLASKVDENKDPSLFPAMELLTLSIEHYDNEHFQVAEADGVSILKYFMEEFNFKQSALFCFSMYCRLSEKEKNNDHAELPKAAWVSNRQSL